MGPKRQGEVWLVAYGSVGDASWFGDERLEFGLLRSVRPPRPDREPRVTAFVSVAGSAVSCRGPLVSCACVVCPGEGTVVWLVPASSGAAFHYDRCGLCCKNW